MSRREALHPGFRPAMALLTPLAANLLQVMLPRAIPNLAILDLPLIVTLYFAVSRRSPIAGTFTGASIGLLQDVLTNRPIGVNGMAKSAVGYAAASLGTQIDVENTATRALLTFGFSLLQSLLLFLIERQLLGNTGSQLRWVHALVAAAANTVVAIPVYLLLDRGRRRE
jgi:rod shape-determining protein MreD